MHETFYEPTEQDLKDYSKHCKEEEEIINIRECLRRVQLESLMQPEYEDIKVAWTGYPKPFPCSHDAIYGFGPLDHPETNNRQGAGRRYQKAARVNQYLCSGDVLFSWPRYDHEGRFKLNSSCVVSLTKTDDSGSTCLVLGITG